MTSTGKTLLWLGAGALALWWLTDRASRRAQHLHRTLMPPPPQCCGVFCQGCPYPQAPAGEALCANTGQCNVLCLCAARCAAAAPALSSCTGCVAAPLALPSSAAACCTGSTRLRETYGISDVPER